MNNLVVYTAISAGYDQLKPVPESWRKKASFVAFLDEPQPGLGWEYQPLPKIFDDPCRNAKIPKILPHFFFPRTRYSLWIDGALQIRSLLPLEQWIPTYLKSHDLALFGNDYYRCIYEEARMCLRTGLDYRSVIKPQMKRYRDEGYPAKNGLVDCGVLLRRHTAKMNRFNERWYREIVMGSRRDQLSFNYVAWKLGLAYQLLPGTYFNNEHFRWIRHATKRVSLRPASPSKMRFVLPVNVDAQSTPGLVSPLSCAI
jgi:hypothetical protein